MIVATEIYKRLFIWGVAAVALIPRQHIDKERCSIGGNLSYSFRKLLLALVVINFARFLLKDSSIKQHCQLLRDMLGIVQQLGNTFLCFLTPYLLQTWLTRLINIGGRPGASLMPTLYASSALSICAAVLVRKVHPGFWALRKLGNAISSPPVLKTLRMFNTVTTHGGTHAGRGTIQSQSLVVIEYWYAAVQVLSVIGFAMNRGKQAPEPNQWDEVWAAFRESSFMLDWTRILAHALFINQLDELYLASPQSSDGPSSPTPAAPETDATMAQTENLPLVRRQAS